MVKDAMQHFAQKSDETFVEKYVLSNPFPSAIMGNVDGGRRNRNRSAVRPTAGNVGNMVT